MKLTPPITVTPPPVTLAYGNTYQPEPVTLEQLDFTVMDNAPHRICAAIIHGIPYPLTLWRDDAYTAAGDYTQSQVEARVMELLGDDPATSLQNLFSQPKM